MKKKLSEDENQAAARVAKEAASRTSQPLPEGLEAAWKAWSAGVGKVDERGMALLRAAFEAGAEAMRLSRVKNKHPDDARP